MKLCQNRFGIAKAAISDQPLEETIRAIGVGMNWPHTTTN